MKKPAELRREGRGENRQQPQRDKPLRLLLCCVRMCGKMKGNRPGGRDLQEECI